MTGPNISAVTGILFLLIYLFQPFHIIKELRKGERLQIPGTKEVVMMHRRAENPSCKTFKWLPPPPNHEELDAILDGFEYNR